MTKTSCAPDDSVHPRPSGEHHIATTDTTESAGSSPPKRGTPAVTLTPTPTSRFIPAQAGNTPQGRTSFRPCPVHPRPSGEHKAAALPSALANGSSPPKRGTRHHDDQDRTTLRFIPAQAGNTVFTAHNAGIPTVHPRPSGEHLHLIGLGEVETGSSPPKRGTRPTAPRARAATAVHPRPSGEHHAFGSHCPSSIGSSPPKRGTPAW